MAGPIFDAYATGNDTETSSGVSYSHVLGGGYNKYIIVGVTAGKNATDSSTFPSSVKYDNVAMTNLENAVIGGAGIDVRVTLWYLAIGNKAPGTYTVAVTLTATVTNGCISACFSFKNAAQIAPEAHEIATANPANPISRSITTLTNNALVVSYVGQRNPGTFSVPATRIFAANNNNYVGEHAGAYLLKETAGSTTVTYTNPGNVEQGALAVVALRYKQPPSPAFLSFL